jgi:hypothetical protein
VTTLLGSPARGAISGADGSGDGGADPSGCGGDAAAIGRRLGPSAHCQGTGLLARDGAQVLSSFTPIRRTLAITWPLASLSEESSLAVAAQVHGDVGLSRCAADSNPL